ncbi:MAG TPA: hypothetical protein ENH20_00710, partial [Candidatus Pacearchaeota archaeon]|nr:hypothetical protein [Candidatus Pacearchaeota archaeon]
MFGSLKEKLKNWVSKNKEEPEEEIIEENPKKKAAKKTAKKKTAKKKAVKKEKPEEKIEKSEEEVKEKKSFFSKFKKGKVEPVKQPTTDNSMPQPNQQNKRGYQQPTTEKKSSFFSRPLTEEKFEELFQELQIILLQNNVAYETVEAIETSLKESLVGKPIKEVNLSKELKSAIESLLINPPNFLEEIKKSESKPFVILFSGINGSGKTTTIAKMANYLQKNKLTTCLAAADTFRAAAIQQLEEHANKLKVPIVKKDYGSDP